MGIVKKTTTKFQRLSSNLKMSAGQGSLQECLPLPFLVEDGPLSVMSQRESLGPSAAAGAHF